jgi:hypothetical protein
MAEKRLDDVPVLRSAHGQNTKPRIVAMVIISLREKIWQAATVETARMLH